MSQSSIPTEQSGSGTAPASEVPLECTHIAGAARPLHLRENRTSVLVHLRDIARRVDPAEGHGGRRSSCRILLFGLMLVLSTSEVRFEEHVGTYGATEPKEET
jgi:hypothetical protein